MTNDQEDDPFHLSADGMREWLAREKADVARATELRIKEATAFVEAYTNREVSQEQLEQHLLEYSRRWGEALPGVGRSGGLSDEEILGRIDATRHWQEGKKSPVRSSRRSRNSAER
jgi:hypothetical protein